jgi:predicted SnoaL-like aldol condensation-catalyzing enzyme
MTSLPNRTLSPARALGALALILVMSIVAPAALAQTEPKMSIQMQQAVDLLKSVATGDPAPSAIINPDHYTQHNLMAADGLAGFLGLQQLVSAGGTSTIETVRAFQDGEYVFTHSEYSVFGRNLVGFDVFRFENGLAVEHWDNVQPAAAPNASGHTMTDGPVAATDLDQTEANKALVRSFVDEIILKRQMDKLAGFFDGDHYIQHNPAVADGVSGLIAAAQALSEAGSELKYDKIHLVLGEGNFVLVASEGTLGGAPTAFFDLFRVEKGKLAEHWDAVATIPERSTWMNANGKF